MPRCRLVDPRFGKSSALLLPSLHVLYDKMTTDDQPYTTADEDPFQIQPWTQPSMLDEWIVDQRRSASASNPYLAYPDLPRASSEQDTQSIISYDLVDDNDIPAQQVCCLVQCQNDHSYFFSGTCHSHSSAHP